MLIPVLQRTLCHTQCALTPSACSTLADANEEPEEVQEDVRDDAAAAVAADDGGDVDAVPGAAAVANQLQERAAAVMLGLARAYADSDSNSSDGACALQLGVLREMTRRCG
jgi:beta-phosphoglucomutase-like phosphatase (HAD superfamily)